MQFELFDVRADGAEEIVAAVGLVSSRLAFDKWLPVLPFGVRDVSAIVGADVVAALTSHYMSQRIDDTMDALVAVLQKAVALFAWTRIIPTLDAQHDTTGRARRVGENEDRLTALEAFKDEANIRRMAYEAVDMLIDMLDGSLPDFWESSPTYASRSALLLRSKAEFDRYYVISSSRLFLTLMPMIREVQTTQILPVIGSAYFSDIMAGKPEVSALGECARTITALLTIKKAVERLPVEVLPEGIVQIQQSASVTQRMKAEHEARQAVAQSLGDDAARYMVTLQNMIEEMDGDDVHVEMPDGPHVHSKGISY